MTKIIDPAGDGPGGDPPPNFSEVGEDRDRQDQPRIAELGQNPPLLIGNASEENTGQGPLVSSCLIILGPTGSGKTGVSIKVAKAIGGEIISADSRAIYKGMDIGTAKPSPEEQSGVPHYGLDLVEPGERFTVADWKAYAEKKITDIRARGKLPMVVGGTGLYIDALIYDYHFHGPTGQKIGDIEQKTCSDRKEIKGNYVIVGIKWEADLLRERLKKRIDQMFSPELYNEVKKLVQRYGWGSGAMKSDIYEYAWKYLQGEFTLTEAKERCFYKDWHLAKRQMTWFKRNPNITWLELDKIYNYCVDLYNKQPENMIK